MLNVFRTSVYPVLLAALMTLATIGHPEPIAAQSTSVNTDTLDASDDPQVNRNFLRPTARPIGDGDVYVSLTNLLFPQVGVGLTDDASLEIGAFAAPSEDFYPDLAIQIRPSLRIHRQQSVDVSLDATAVITKSDAFFGGHDWSLEMHPRLLLTTGSDRASLTAGLGVPLIAEGGEVNSITTSYLDILAAGQVRLFPWMKLITETNILPGYRERFLLFGFTSSGRVQTATFENETTRVLTTNGFRFYGDRFSADVAVEADVFFNPVLEEDLSLAPVLRFAYRF
ncbi:hypothetical protein [Longibacter sp.]|jgi:hypothetical protein|uniref:hypothetical protein n=1 Tax=Longibacter sp. TaxID=2045415 RepID=UPI003EBD2BDD